MSTELGSDPSDPLSLNMLLNTNNGSSSSNNSASEEDDSDAVGGAQDQDHPEDWSKFGTLWSPHHPSSFKSYDFMDLSDFSSSVPMSMDSDLGIAMGMDYSYSSMMGIDPTSLHFNPAAAGLALGGGYALGQDVPTGFVDSYAPPGAAGFGFQQQHHHHHHHHQHQQQHSVTAPLSTQGSASPVSFAKERRLSVTSSSSSSVSGASLSPMPDQYNALSPPPSGYTSDNVSTKDEPNSNLVATAEATNPYANDPTAELAHRVRQSAGVMLAVPISGFGSSSQGGNVSAGKLPTPRLNRPMTTTLYAKSTTISAPPSSSPSSASSAASTPPPSTPPSTSHSPLNVFTNTSAVSASIPTPTTAAAPRPKTSHTTIERRYRTNLNARIQSLRMAVPALRVLEDQGGSNCKRIKKNIKGGVIVKGGGIGIGSECSEDGSVVDVIDERGFVDGVKVARKCSKANVLGKAVEYIRVLKRREKRLKSELSGVKVLVEGLVGGPALIREWEKQWRARFGGEEKDEVEEDYEEGEDEESEDEDGEDGDEEGAGRKRKRPKVSPTSTSGGLSKKVDSKKEKKTAPPSLPPVVVLARENGNPVPEKRKRGRPRKILPPPVTLEPVANAPPSVSTLLPAAVIAQRDGSASIKQDEVMEPAHQWQQQQQSPPQRFLLAVFALFSFFNSPLTSSMGSDYSSHNHNHHTGKVLTSAHPPLVYSPEITSQFVQYPPALVDTLSTAPMPVWKEYVQLFHLAVSFLVLASFVGNWFGFGVSGFRFSFERRGWDWGLRSTGGTGKDKRGKGNDWIRFAAESVLSGEAGSLSHFERIQIYRAISGSVSLESLVSAAIALNSASGVFGGLARMKARAIWEDASRKVKGSNKVKAKEEIVFGSMGLDAACERLASCVKRGDPDEMSDGETEYDLIEVLACGVVKERVRNHLGRMFVEFVAGNEDEDEVVEQQEEDKLEDESRRRKTIDASRELGGSVEEMGRLFERMWKIGVGGVEMEDVECVFSNVHVAGGVNEEIRALFVAHVLHARLFGGPETESSEETETEGGLSSSSDTVIVSNSSLLSPPPSPARALGLLVPSNMKSSKRDRMMLELRKVLGCRVFEGCVGGGGEHECREEEKKVGDRGFSEGLEEARDLVVDLIVDFERRDR